MRFFIFLLIGSFQISLAQAGELPVTKTMTEHRFHQGETLWFLSNVYYGKGTEYKKIVEANHLTGTESLKDGMVLHIPGTIWKNDTADFKVHYKEIWDQRENKLFGSNHHPAVDSRIPKEPTQKITKEKSVTKAAFVAGTKEDDSSILVVPIPTSPIFPAGQVPAPGSQQVPSHRSATEGVNH